MKTTVKAFLDTSVLIAASDAEHPEHMRSIPLLAAATKQTTACGAHTLAEFYAVISRLPGGKRQRPEIAAKLVEQIIDKMAVISLTAEEYAATIRNLSKAAFAGGIVFDALLLACARKVGAERIYTLNARHFRMIAPDMADRIVAP